jgi:RHS repeat-associated protein
LGSTSLVTDEEGNEVSRLHYSPYGSLIEQSGAESLPTDRLFTGQRLENIGLYDYRARFYDPLTANFLSPDSLVPRPGNPVDWNRYAYVRGNPVRYSDPSGHQGCDGVGNPAIMVASHCENAGGPPNAPEPRSGAGISAERNPIPLLYFTDTRQFWKELSPEAWHDEIDAEFDFSDKWMPFIEFGLSIAMMTGSGVPSRPPTGYRQPPSIVVHYTSRGNYKAIRSSGFVFKPSPAEGLIVEPAPPGVYFGDINPPFPGLEPPYTTMPIRARWGIYTYNPEYFIAVSPSSLPKGRVWYARLWPHNEGRPEWILVTSEPIDVSSGVIGHGHIDLLNKWWLRNK